MKTKESSKERPSSGKVSPSKNKTEEKHDKGRSKKLGDETEISDETTI